jgi:hypothetical protein
MDDSPEHKPMYLAPDEPPTERVDDPPAPPKPAAKVTARMLKIRELIEHGEYPDRDELAERIIDKL